MYKPVAQLASAKIFTQLVIFLLLPIITRVYTPEAIGGAVSVYAIASVVMAVASLAYHLAIPMIKDDDELISILYLCFIITLIVMVAFFALVTWFVPKTIIDIPTVVLMSVAISVGSTNAIFSQLFIRFGRYKSLSITQVVSSLGTYFLALSIGALDADQFSYLLSLAGGPFWR